MDISENSEPLPGYRLIRFLGRGSYGEAWEAVAPGDMPVAIKFIRLEQSLTESDQREFDILRKVRHAHLLDVHLVQEKEGYLLMGMPLCDQDLLGRLKECQDQGLPGIPSEELMDLMEESAKALDFLHGHNVIHRDIKPANIFLVGGTAKVADFGLARVLNHSLSMQSGIKGTPAYVAPEIVQGKGAKASDQYSLAVSYCQLRTGGFPIKADGVMALLLAQVQNSPDLRGYAPQEAKVLERALAKNPDDRWPTCRAFIKALRKDVDDARASQSPQPEKPTSALDSPATITIPPDVGKPPSKRKPEVDAIQNRNRRSPENRLTQRPREHKLWRTEKACESVGIDLGSTHSAMAFMDSNMIPRMVINSKGQSIIPSVVYFGEEEVLVGEPALEIAEIEAEHVAQSIQVHMGESWRKTYRGHEHTPESISAIIMGHLVKQASHQIGPVKKAVITVPTYFNEKRRRATQFAGEIAGLEVIGTLNEPVSATLAYGLHRLKEEQTVAVYDLGGGTFDVTIVKITPDEIAELSTKGNRELGGKDWDHALVEYFAQDFEKEHGVNPATDPQGLQDLILACEKAKRRLTNHSKAKIRLHACGKAHITEVTRELFEELTSDLLEMTRMTMEMALRKADLGWSDVDRVVLVGGSTFMPMVHKMIEESTGRPPDTNINPVMAVALGAAIYAYMLETGRAPKIRTIKSSKSRQPNSPTPAMDSPAKISIPPDVGKPPSTKRTKRKYKAGEERSNNGLQMPLIAIPPGMFLMGSPKDESGRRDNENQDIFHTGGFWLGKFTVTQEEWKQLMNSQPWNGNVYVQNDPRCPATYVSWEDAMAFCQKFTEQERQAGRLSPSWEYTLPTEAQWEYACRAGTTTRFCFGNNDLNLSNYAWFVQNANDMGGEYAHPVGQKQSNPWNLYDMHGNVWEWCQDWFQEKLPGGQNPVVTERASQRVLRGGCWYYSAEDCRSARRSGGEPSSRGSDLGFRVAVVRR